MAATSHHCSSSPTICRHRRNLILPYHHHLVLLLLLVIMMMMMHVESTPTYSKCLFERPDVVPKRHFYFNSTNLPITIETSSRPSHQLTSRVLRILLEEVLGYSKVKLLGEYNSMDTEEILNRLSGNNSMIPETMVNLEIWVRSGFNLEALVSRSDLINAGPLGSTGRFGWFMPKHLVDERWNASRIAIDHWKALRLPSVTSLFSLDSQSERIANLTARVVANDDGERSAAHCDGNHGNGCHGGIHYPPGTRCRHGNSSSSSSSTCAVLLSSSPDLDVGLLAQQITNLDLNVGVAFIGDRLNSFVEHQLSRDTPVLFFNWIPNDLTSTGSYSRVLFPMCQSSQKPPTNCDFEVHQLTKIVWATIKSHTPDAYHLISRMQLNQDEVNDLLVGYYRKGPRTTSGSSERDLESAACEWVRLNERLWKKWIPENLSSKTPIYLGGMFPITGPFWRQPGIVPGAVMAVEYVNNDDTILPDHELILLIQDTQCTVDLAMTQFLAYAINKTHPIAGIVGPACAETVEPVAGVSKHFNTVVISYHAEAFQLTDRIQFPFFFRMRPHILQYGVVYVELMRHFGWEQVALLAEDGQGYPEYHGFLKDLFLSRSIQVVYDRKIPRQSKVEDAAKYIDELKKKDVRIIILTSFEQAAGAVLCEAYRKGLTAADGYVWFVPSWFTYNWWLNSYYKIPCTPEEMKVAVQGHFYLDTAYLGQQDTHIVGNVTVRQWQQEYQRRMGGPLRKHSSAYASYAYDTVLVFALGLHKLLTQDPSSLESLHTDKTVDRFMYFLNNTHFSGASGPVQFVGADRTGIINVHQQMTDSSILIGQFVLDNGNVTDRLRINDTKVVWFTSDGRQPTDGHLQPKKCSIEGFRLLLGVECDSAIVIANVIGISIFVIIMLICLVALKKWYDRQVDKMKRTMDPYHLLEKLDKWQIPRDKVVLNRKIGEGTSGTVYGGEANINGTWVAVAVKTLKTGASLEEKLDFLSEAEMMKEFDHRNIVKLLGVCTAGDPIYMIMEFMLHGDLKTFLLARRQMVGQTTSEAEDVSSRGLTKMALNVANGLKYLSTLNYVHRDLACRNCLVNSDKTVLIGDFGMTKCMFDKDYYQFNQKGKFPVRWMAPESLRDGLFTTASDIWSYGVLLYEIMTLGSFPYQGHCNKDVLELVKNGKRIEIPQMCSPKVKALLLSCWEFNHENRPTIDSIIELLEQYPELIEPCLDGPSSAIALDLTASLEVNLLPNFKSRTTTTTMRQRLSSDNTLNMGAFSMSSQDIGSNDDFSPEPNQLDPFCSSKRPSITTDEPLRKPSDMTRRSCRFSLDSFRRSMKLGLSISSDEPTSDDRASATSELQNGFFGDVEKPALQTSPYGAGNYSMSKKRLNALLMGNGRCEEDNVLMNAAQPPPSVESKTDSDYCSQNSKHLPYAECLPFV